MAKLKCTLHLHIRLLLQLMFLDSLEVLPVFLSLLMLPKAEYNRFDADAPQDGGLVCRGTRCKTKSNCVGHISVHELVFFFSVSVFVSVHRAD